MVNKSKTMKEKIKKIFFLIISIILGVVLSFVTCYALLTGKGLGEDCFLQREDGSCITIFSFSPNIVQIIIFLIFSIFISIGIYRGLKEQFQ